jgi:hypothetical protein
MDKVLSFRLDDTILDGRRIEVVGKANNQTAFIANQSCEEWMMDDDG